MGSLAVEAHPRGIPRVAPSRPRRTLIRRRREPVCTNLPRRYALRLLWSRWMLLCEAIRVLVAQRKADPGIIWLCLWYRR